MAMPTPMCGNGPQWQWTAVDGNANGNADENSINLTISAFKHIDRKYGENNKQAQHTTREYAGNGNGLWIAARYYFNKEVQDGITSDTRKKMKADRLHAVAKNKGCNCLPEMRTYGCSAKDDCIHISFFN